MCVLGMGVLLVHSTTVETRLSTRTSVTHDVRFTGLQVAKKNLLG